MNRCDGCQFYRPIKDLNDRGIPVGECHQAPPAFRGSPHTGNAFLGAWIHVRAHWECGQFQPAEGPQPAAPTDEDDREDSPGDGPPPLPLAPAPPKARKRIEGNRR